MPGPASVPNVAALGSHLLLLGEQGVGKNKLADKLLELLNAEREYIQLHRDTTVASLTQVSPFTFVVVHIRSRSHS